jgi:hypothetical protein
MILAGLNNQDGKFTWASVPNSGFQAYGLNISLDSDPSTYQLSNGFYISGAESSATSQKAEQTSTITLAPGPSYSAHVNTTTSAPWTTKSNVTQTSVANSTWAQPTTLTSQTSTAAVVTTAALSSTPASSPSPSTSAPASGAVANVASGGLAMIGGLLLALAL